MGLISPDAREGLYAETQNNAGQQRIYPVIFFKMLVLQQLFNLGTDVAFRLQLMKFYPR